MANSGIVGFDDGPPGEDSNYGWNRASIQYRSRGGYTPAIRADDLLMPNGLGSWRLLWRCGAMALMMTVLYVWTALFFVNIWVPLGGRLYGGALGGALITFTLLLYFFGARETRRDRELAARL
jgi:hypothetical protein